MDDISSNYPEIKKIEIYQNSPPQEDPTPAVTQIEAYAEDMFRRLVIVFFLHVFFFQTLFFVT